MGKHPDSSDTGRRFLREAIERKLNFHGLSVGVVALEYANKAVDAGDGLWWLLPGWWEWAVSEDARKRLELDCNCHSPDWVLAEECQRSGHA